MTKNITLISMIFMLGLTTYYTERKVSYAEFKLKQINNTITNYQESMHILGAEWDYLNNPVRLMKLAKHYKNMQPIKNRQLVSYKIFTTLAKPILHKTSFFTK